MTSLEQTEESPLISHTSLSVENDDAPKVQKNQLGMLLGVAIPSMLSCYGVIVFERWSFVVGEVGLIGALGMLFIDYAVVLLTVLSLSAMATNGQVRGGGSYYIISRALGPEFGGSIGVVFFFVNVIAGAFFSIGFAEAIAFTFVGQAPEIENRWWKFFIATIILGVFVAICLVGAGFYVKISAILLIMIFIALGLGIGSFFFRDPIPEFGLTGPSSDTLKSNLLPDYSPDYNFRNVLAIQFPFCTGLIAGSNMSGDLKDPIRSIPKGTLIATVITFFSYLILAITFASTTLRVSEDGKSGMKNEFFLLQAVSINGWPILIGLFAAAGSSALNGIVSGGRILQALARDDVFPFFRFFATGSKKGDEPRRAMILLWILSQCLLFIGDINTIAELITMCFLLLFTFINAACFLLKISGAPNFRPLYKYFSWHTALLGCLGAATCMFVVNPLYALISIVILCILFFYIHYRSPSHSWGDITQALIFHQVRKYLLMLNELKAHIKFWRPQFLLFVSNPRASANLITFMNKLKKGGLLMLGHVLVGDPFNPKDVAEYSKKRKLWLDLIQNSQLKAFINISLSPNLIDGMMNMIMLSGLGGFQSNAVVFDFHEENPKECKIYSSAIADNISHFPELKDENRPALTLDQYANMIRTAKTWNKSILITRNFDLNYNERSKFYIDVWILEEDWVNDETIHWIIMLGYLIRDSDFGKKSQLRVCSIVESSPEIRRDYLTNLLFRYRIHAILQVFTAAKSESRLKMIEEVLIDQSIDTRVAFLPLLLPPKDPKDNREWYSFLHQLSKSSSLPPLIFVHGSTSVLTTDL